MKYLIANWKAQMNQESITSWLNKFTSIIRTDTSVMSVLDQKLTLIICPPAPYLEFVKNSLKQLPIKTGAQSISHYPEGKYTGEVTAKMAKEFVSYAIIGHSERRRYLHETNEDIQDKIEQCRIHHIEPVLCVRNEDDTIYDDVTIVAYEPVEAIGTGQNAEAEEVIEMKKQLNIGRNTAFLYGGSADETNIEDYLKTGEVDGFLVGTASLDPEKFYLMVKKMSKEQG